MSEIKSQMQELISTMRENVNATQDVNESVKGLKDEQKTLMKWLIGAVIIIALGRTGLEAVRAFVPNSTVMAETKK